MSKRGLSFMMYAVLLFLLPLIEGSFVAPLFLPPFTLLFPGVALAAYFVVPRRAWWYTSLFAALWRDLILLLPPGASLAGVLTLGAVVTFFSMWLTNRSFWTDAITMIVALVASLLVEFMVEVIAVHFGILSRSVFPSF